jgi:hypothetical protein
MMSAITRVGADKLVPENSGPEQYAPPDRRTLGKLRNGDQAVREVVPGDVSFLSQQQSEAGPAAENLDDLIRRVGRASVEEIDRVILELQGVRDLLHNEGDRLGHEIARYSALSQMSMTAMQAIADGLKRSKVVPNKT